MEHLLDKDYWHDHFNYSQLYCNTAIEDDGNEIYISRLEDIQADIIETENAAAASFFALETNYETHKMQRVVLQSNDPKYLTFFARFIKNADIKALQKALFACSEDSKLYYLCQFARFIPQANIKKIQELIVKSNDAHAAHIFLKYIKEASPDKLKKIILTSGKPRYLYYLAKRLSSAKEITIIEDLIIISKSFLYIRLMAQNISHADLNKLEQFVLDTGNVKEIKKFARSVKNSKSRHLAILF